MLVVSLAVADQVANSLSRYVSSLRHTHTGKTLLPELLPEPFFHRFFHPELN
ncbi:hypothetical protein LNP17_06480 [Klebsiella variicola subsp. variicola]|nr:hypothetical protein [Klebsiella variicola subsp. variicola]